MTIFSEGQRRRVQAKADYKSMWKSGAGEDEADGEDEEGEEEKKALLENSSSADALSLEASSEELASDSNSETRNDTNEDLNQSINSSIKQEKEEEGEKDREKEIVENYEKVEALESNVDCINKANDEEKPDEEFTRASFDATTRLETSILLKETPLPKDKVIPLMLMLFMEAFNSNSIFPYVGYMIYDFHIVPNNDTRLIG